MTIKQRKVAKELFENGGTMASALRKAGYSKAMIKNPQKVTRSKAFKEIIENMGLDNKSLAKALKEGLNATKIITRNKKNLSSNSMPDYAIRHKYLVTALELKGYIGRNSKPLTEGRDVVFINSTPRPYSQTIITKQREE